MNALAKPKVGDYLNDHFVSSHQKVGTFQKIGNDKVGGNVACYFCKIDGTVIHAIPGPVDEATFLSEARFAVELHHSALFLATTGNNKHANLTQKKTVYAKVIKKGFEDRVGPTVPANKSIKPVKGAGWQPDLSQQGMVNATLYQTPLPRLEVLYPYLWEKVLHEKLSAAPIAVR